MPPTTTLTAVAHPIETSAFRIAAPATSAAPAVPPRTPSEATPTTALPPPRHRWLRRIVTGLAVVITGLAAAGYYSVRIAPYESTDDAIIEAHVTAVAPQIAGRVVELLVEDNQVVHQGDVLLRIDPSDAQAQLDQAQAMRAASQSRLVEARAQLSVDQARIEQEKAGVVAAEAEAQRAGTDAKRYQAIARIAISDSQLDFASTLARSTAAQVQVARNKALAAEAQLELARAAITTASAEVEHATAVVRTAELNLSHTRITAPEDCFVTHRTVEAGSYVQIGQALLAIVPRQVWIVANFKETQLEHMRAGQPVTVNVDAYPQVAFTGHVDSIQSGAGAHFSLLPPENATGNYVKVVQRLPVKIVLDAAPDARYVLGPGMSVVPEVRVK